MPGGSTLLFCLCMLHPLIDDNCQTCLEGKLLFDDAGFTQIQTTMLSWRCRHAAVCICMLHSVSISEPQRGNNTLCCAMLYACACLNAMLFAPSHLVTRHSHSASAQQCWHLCTQAACQGSVAQSITRFRTHPYHSRPETQAASLKIQAASLKTL